MNLFEIPPTLPTEEFVEALVVDQGILIERIISTGQASPSGFWYDQDRDEWVVVLQGQAILSWEDGRQQAFMRGDWVFIPAHEKHRVEWTSSEPACIWLAVHGTMRKK